jgi:flagellar L-ring protein precursor FlgH
MQYFSKGIAMWNKFGAALLAAFIVQAPAAATSLYKQGSYQALTSDVRARQVGDVITVMVYENASAVSAADTSAGREASVALELQGTGKGGNASVGAGNHTDARGRTQREGKLLAQITVTIKEITPTGDLVIGGEQILDINNERQQIALDGRVRPQDVSDTNVVMSTRIANARIRYTGQGDLADKQRPAWWQRFLTLFGV